MERLAMTPFGYVGIDFGTSNSHFAYCNRDGDLKPQTIHLGGKASLTTCVL
jgi:molecular chaperone DnaK (HSP70)